MKHTVYLGLGSNVGDRIEFLATAIRGIADFPLTVVDDVSDVYSTEPVGEVQQGDFLNVCVSVRTDAEYREFHSMIKELERVIGRTESVRWGPREIDVDLLFFDHVVIHTEELTIPHKEIVNRRFVLQPLADIAPMYIHPQSGKTISELLAAANDAHGIERSGHFTSQLLMLINDSITNPTV
ncbi:MAG: 2-amino-4-hydroxy-6-hydroxymethyldihydropteridine diphosphokinase [Ignavibacteriales bacterium]|nr:2-amino-4-hydroxy-6-hydroxymethyldihydropteridine diphosphokinase [Ignavibacteriales bacterium]